MRAPSRPSWPAALWHLALALAFALLFAVVGSGQARGEEPARRSAAELMDVLMWNREPVGGPFSLTDHSGQARSDADFRGKLLLVYFGFTYCPDICPTDLVEISRTIDQLGPAGEIIQPLFVTLDPERDTSAQLAEYVPLFHSRLIGLTGSAEAVRAAADAYKVFYRKVEIGGGDYTVDHSAYVYLLDTEGRYLGFFPPNTPAERMLTIIRSHLPRG
ncbi:MAG TPA: SCO family protein [Bosea sp. (in: a-proteobacteria)]|jgi:protein SCO1/2|uniref:SCO family protein n=1 Tax=Bosea sp. (in: a-proteobacteria) TaxID=1871050 RepID=UPI002E0D90C2|nr:SCO family protein [Bosea sp. (in: a-proteobacteria)]